MAATPSSIRRYAALAIAALTLRILYVCWTGLDGIQPGTDGVSYDTFARMMLGGWDWITTPWAMREPLYPAFMALAYSLPGPDFAGLVGLQILASSAVPVILYWGLRPYVRERLALLAAFIVCVNPHALFMTPLPLRENLILPLLAWVTGLIIRVGSGRDKRTEWWLALAWALLIHADSRYLPYLVVLPPTLWCLGRPVRAVAAGTVRVGLIVLLLLVPYTVRGTVAFGRPVVLTDRFLDRFVPLFAERVTGSDTQPTGVPQEAWMADWVATKGAAVDSMSTAERKLFLVGERPALRGPQVQLFYFQEYWRFARFHPAYEVYPYGRFLKPWSRIHNLMSIVAVVPFFLALPFALWGKIPGPEKRIVWAMLILIGVHCLMHVMSHAVERYRYPMEVPMAVVIAVGLLAAFQFLRNPSVGAVQSLLE